MSALTVHHLDGQGKADLFQRVRAVVAPGGAFVLADLVVPEVHWRHRDLAVLLAQV